MKIEDILVPIDFSPGSLRALDYAWRWLIRAARSICCT